MGDSYREALKANRARIRTKDPEADNRAKAATRTAIRKLNSRKSRALYNKAFKTQVRMF